MCKENSEENDEFFKCFRGLLIFGRLIGLVPYKGVFSKSSRNLKFKWLSIPCFISCAIISVLSFNCVMECIHTVSQTKNNAFDIIQSIRSTLYYIWGTFIYINFVTRSKAFVGMFKAFRGTSVVYTEPDSKLKRDVILISAVVLISGTLENAILYWGYIVEAIDLVRGVSKSKDKHSILSAYYTNSHPSWAKFIPYNAFLAIVAFFQHKIILFAWNLMDIWIALLARVLYFKFQALVKVGGQQLAREKPRFTNNPKPIDISDHQNWIQLVKDHSALCYLLEAFEKFLSPLIFISYTVNIYYVSMQLLDGLTVSSERSTLAEAINAPWSFVHLIMRVYLVSTCCAKINTYAHEISNIIHECPRECYNTDVARLDKRVVGGRDIGLTGLNCFTVVKPFFLSVAGVVFTIEIVLLQIVPPEKFGINQVCNCCCKN